MDRVEFHPEEFGRPLGDICTISNYIQLVGRLAGLTRLISTAIFVKLHREALDPREILAQAVS